MKRILTSWLAMIPLVAGSFARASDVVLVEDGKPRCAIYVAPTVMSAQPIKGMSREAESQRQRLRESVKDLALYIEKMSGAVPEIMQAEPRSGDMRLPIIVGDRAAKTFGPVGKTFPYRQGFRLVVSPRGIGLLGESDLAASYAVYELLDRLGCRWYMPGDMGEVIPEHKTIRLPEMDFRSAPATIFRGGPPCDLAWQRRNRLGGMPCICGFGSVEGFVSPEQRRQHPDWLARIAGNSDPLRLRWSNRDVASAIAGRILAKQAIDPQPAVSFFLAGGSDYDESKEDLALDAGDFDPIFQRVSVSDRFMVLANHVAEQVSAKSPDTLLLLSAYTAALRAPVRERVHPNVVPVLVPSVYDRAHPLTDDQAPGNTDLRHAIEGWGKSARMTGYYAYAYNLAEPTAPNPMMARYSADLPILLNNNCRLWIPESVANFETSLPALYLAARLTWDKDQNPAALIDRLMSDFYGHAAGAMKAYWQFIDDAWAKTPEYAGAEFAYGRRFNPAVMREARRLMDTALAAAQTPAEQFRVNLAGDSLHGFELFMNLHEDLADGRFAGLKARNDDRHQFMLALALKFKPNFAFGGARAMPLAAKAYADADRIARDFQILTPRPLRAWRFHLDMDKQGLDHAYAKSDFDDTAWPSTDPCVQTWSAWGLGNYYGSTFYRASVRLPDVAGNKKVYLWLSMTDGSADLFANGQHIPFAGGDVFTGFCQPVSFEITSAIRARESNQITIRCTRTSLNEIGTGGLLGPVVIYAEK